MVEIEIDPEVATGTPAKNPEPRKHHFDPKCHLAGFTEDGEQTGHLWVTDFKRQKQWRSSPVNAAHRRDYYRLTDQNVDPLMAETAFANIESIVAPLLKSLYADPRLPTDCELGDLVYFAAIQFIRVPAYRPMLLWMAQSIHRKWLAEALKTPKSWAKTLKKSGSSFEGVDVNYERMLKFQREVMDSGEYTLSAETDWFIKRGFNAVKDVIVPSFGERLWRACISSSGSFIGSDNPVVMDGPQDQTVGFVSADVIVFVVNRRLLLYGTNMEVRPQRVTRNLIARHNTLTMLKADEQVYSHTPDFCWIDETGKYQTDWRQFSKEKILESATTHGIQLRLLRPPPRP